MPSKTAEICGAAVATVAVAGAVVALAICCPDAFKPDRVVIEPQPRVTVQSAPAMPRPGVPAYKIPMGQPYVVSSSQPSGIRLPRTYRYGYVVYNGVNYPIYTTNGGHYFVYNGVRYPVCYY